MVWRENRILKSREVLKRARRGANCTNEDKVVEFVRRQYKKVHTY
jgi:hypothetical protein